MRFEASPAIKVNYSSVLTNIIKLDMNAAFFQSFFVNNAAVSSPIKLLPIAYDHDRPGVVAELDHKQTGEMLGVSKVKGGNRVKTVYLAAMCAVFRPPAQKCTV